MTLQDLMTAFSTGLLEYEGSVGYDDPISAKGFILRAVDKYARSTDAFWYKWQVPAVNGQATYCAPMLYKLRSINYFTEQGNWYPLDPKSTAFMDGRGGGGIGNNGGGGIGWRNLVPISYPRRCVVDGMNSIRLVPPPIVDTIVSPLVQPLLEFEGFAIPSKCFKSDGVTKLFDLPTDECPLNAVCHDGVLYEAQILRTMQYPTPENRARLPLLQEMSQEYLSALGGFAFNFKPPYRFDQKYRWTGN